MNAARSAAVFAGVGIVVCALATWWWRGTEIDARIREVQPGAFVGDVVETLGTPNGRAWRRRPDTGEVVFVYEGRNTYSIRFRAGYAAEVADGRLGGPAAPVFNQPATEVELPER